MANAKSLDLTTHLQSLIPADTHPSLRQEVIPKLLHCIADVAQALKSSQKVSQVGTVNAFGDDQLNVDVIAEQIIRSTIAECPSIVTASSEEDPVERSSTGVEESIEQYTLAFDPLDGSSIIAPNWTVGTIIGIWEGSTALHQSPKKQIASILGVYGPRTTAVVALRIPGAVSACFEVGVGDGSSSNSSIEIVRPSVQLQDAPFKTRYFAPANLRAAAEDERYMKLITHFITQKYTLRYSGGLVPDVVHALVKGHGIYVSPVTSVSKAKLRRLYELAPIALIVECAGGLAIDGTDGRAILERPIGDTDERAGLICGTAEEVELVRRLLIS